MECGNYPGSKLLEHGMKGIKRQLEKRLRDIGLLAECNLGPCLVNCLRCAF